MYNPKINISTRLLTYFLFVTILPLFVLTITSTLLLNNSLNDKLNYDLRSKIHRELKTQEEYFDNLKLKNSTLIFEIALLTALAGVALAYILSMSITNPLSKVTNAAIAIEKGDFSKRVDVKSNDELGYLSQAFNSMATTLQNRNKEILSYNQLLFDQNKKIEAVIDSSVDGIITIDNNWRITSANSTFMKWTGLNKADILNKIIYEIIKYRTINRLPPVNIDKIKTLEDLHLHYPAAIIVNVKNSEVIDLDIAHSHIKNDEDSNNEESYVLILRNVTKKKELDKLKEDFVATLTHDLKVPLLANVQTLEFLMKGSYGDLTEKQKFITEHLIASNKDLLRMVNIILDSYKYEAGKQTLIIKKTSLNKLINESITEIESLVKEKNHNLTFEPHNEKIEVMADKQEIKRVVINLLSNAITYTPEKGQIKVSTKPDKNNIIVSIKDNGIGIADISVKNLFERFSKESNTLRKIGTGLGLYLSKHIVEAHNGKIWVESSKDIGSTFYFSIPVYDELRLNNNE